MKRFPAWLREPVTIARWQHLLSGIVITLFNLTALIHLLLAVWP
jgi:hypothetical protein